MNNQGLPLYAGSINSNQINMNYDINYLNNLLKINKGKKIKVFTTLSENNEFNGILEYSGQDFIIISNPNNGNWYVILISYINFICFEEQINY